MWWLPKYHILPVSPTSCTVNLGLCGPCTARRQDLRPPSLFPPPPAIRRWHSHDTEPSWPQWGLHDPRSNLRGVQPSLACHAQCGPQTPPVPTWCPSQEGNSAHSVFWSPLTAVAGLPCTAAKNEQMLVCRTEDETQDFVSPGLRGRGVRLPVTHVPCPWVRQTGLILPELVAPPWVPPTRRQQPQLGPRMDGGKTLLQQESDPSCR